MAVVPMPSRRFRTTTRVTKVETVVFCSGRLTSDSAADFRDEVRKLIPTTKVLVLDFTNVEHLDSSGIGAVVRLYVSAKQADCELRLVNFNQRVRDLLGLTGLLKIFGDCGKYMVRMP
jgi:anti-anti-sigma factor